MCVRLCPCVCVQFSLTGNCRPSVCVFVSMCVFSNQFDCLLQTKFVCFCLYPYVCLQFSLTVNCRPGVCVFVCVHVCVCKSCWLLIAGQVCAFLSVSMHLFANQFVNCRPRTFSLLLADQEHFQLVVSEDQETAVWPWPVVTLPASILCHFSQVMVSLTFHLWCPSPSTFCPSSFTFHRWPSVLDLSSDTWASVTIKFSSDLDFFLCKTCVTFILSSQCPWINLCEFGLPKEDSGVLHFVWRKCPWPSTCILY